MNDIVTAILDDAISLKQTVRNDTVMQENLLSVSKRMLECHRQGGTMYMCGNGGSACDAMHFCEELVARYKRERPGMRALHFMDAAMMTCWSNDYSYDTQFSRYAEVFCSEKDILFAFSTSGNSANVIKAVETAREKKSWIVGFTGKDGGKLADISDIAFVVPSEHTERIQEIHITLVHILCELSERSLLEI